MFTYQLEDLRSVCQARDIEGSSLVDLSVFLSVRTLVIIWILLSPSHLSKVESGSRDKWFSMLLIVRASFAHGQSLSARYVSQLSGGQF